MLKTVIEWFFIGLMIVYPSWNLLEFVAHRRKKNRPMRTWQERIIGKTKEKENV